ncbi:MAG: hypothetical protein CMI56_00040 [Parcubacteria group bacterium]|mgnify:CR=1 FL=1|nr:hypothetical protein [Parcubacteria group bacterium]|tara:strand:- start:3174 stop:3491 length:318 start_codon:yes stop_codon:yes gene_type:complete
MRFEKKKKKIKKKNLEDPGFQDSGIWTLPNSLEDLGTAKTKKKKEKRRRGGAGDYNFKSNLQTSLLPKKSGGPRIPRFEVLFTVLDSTKPLEDLGTAKTKSARIH